MWATLWLLVMGCAPADDPVHSAGIDLQPVVDGDWRLAEEASLVQSEQGLALHRHGEVTWLARRLVGMPAVSADGRRWVLSHTDDERFVGVLEAWELRDGEAHGRVLVERGSPDRAALSDDGELVVYVSGITGIASVWAMPFDGGTAVQLSNVGVELQPREPGTAPTGFVAPPHGGPLRIEGNLVVWDSPEGPQQVDLP